MSTLILLRHGQSLWNARNLFTGWVDVALSPKGIEEAIAAGKQLSDTPIDLVFCSQLIRAQHTALLALAHHSSGKVPVVQHDQPDDNPRYSDIHQKEAVDNQLPVFYDERLNERYYGQLQGLDKQKARDTFGDEQIKLWRRSFDVPPPEGECLAMTAKRTLPCFNERIVSELDQGRNCLVSAHGNSLRAIVMHIEKLSKEAVLNLEIATGDPILYDYSDGEFKRK